MVLRLTAGEMFSMPKPSTPRVWVVDGLLQTRTKRPSLLCGYAEAGKSTFATQLAIAVAHGTQVIGRATQQGGVIFWKYEDSAEDTFDDFKKAGMKETDPITLLFPDYSDEAKDDKDTVAESNIEALVDELKRQPDTKLVVIETLSDFFNPGDITSNDEGRQHLKMFMDRVTKPYPDCAYLILHHFNKNELGMDVTRLSIAKVLGGQCYVAGTSTKIYMQQVSDADTRRVLTATTRKGVNIEPTYLDFDRATNTSTLGRPVREENIAAKQVARNKKIQNIDESLLHLAEENPGTPKWDLVGMVSGKRDTVGRRVDFLITRGDLEAVSEAEGRRHSKLIYGKGKAPLAMEQLSPDPIPVKMEEAADDDYKYIEEQRAEFREV